MSLAALLLLLAPTLEREAPSTLPGFVENRGQWVEDVRFAAAGRLGTRRVVVRAEERGVAIQVEEQSGDGGRGVLLRVELDGVATPIGRGERAERHHAYIGRDPAGWVRGARAFDRVEYVGGDGAPLLGVAFDATGVSLERLAPGVGWRVRGDEDLRAWLGDQGLRVSDGALAVQLAVQLDAGLAWATYLGGAEGINEVLEDVVACDALGPQRLLIAGATTASDFPVTPGAYVPALPGPKKAVVASFDAATGAVQWCATIGGEHVDDATGVGADASGRVLLAGSTSSKTFPTTPGAHQTSYDGFTKRGFVLQLAPDGSQRLWSTYLGGQHPDGTALRAMRVRADGAPVVVGMTGAPDFAVTPGAFQTAPVSSVDAFVTVVRPDGADLVWSTRLGSTKVDDAHAVALGTDGTVTVVGHSGTSLFPTTPGALKWNPPPTGGSSGLVVFVTRVAADGASLVWSGLVGWPGSTTTSLDVTVGADGRVAVAGQTWGSPVPTTPGCLQSTWAGGRDGFVFVVEPDGSGLIGGTWLGGPLNDALMAVDIDASGVVTVGGWSDVPMPWLTETPALEPNATGATLFRLSPDLSQVLSGHAFGGSGWFGANDVHAIALLPQGAVAAVGTTITPDFPTTPGAYQPEAPGGQWDCFVARHRMLPSGVDRAGRSGPDCSVGAYLAAAGEAQAGNVGFSLYASNLPPSAAGLLALGLPSPSPLHLGGGFALHVDATGPLVLVPWQSDASGVATLALPLPTDLAGLELAAQLVLAAPPSCASDLAWTHALRIAIGG